MVTSIRGFIDEHYKPPQPDPETRAQRVSAESNGLSVFDQLDELMSFANALEPEGWNQVKPGDTATLEAWRRPGATHPISAKVLKANPHVLVVWSEDAGLPSGAGQKLTKARLCAHLHYGDDESALSAFAKDLVRGQAKGVPAHVNQALRGKWEVNGYVSEVSANQITGDNSEEKWSRLVDLRPYLDGTVKKPQPDVGGKRDDGVQLLYPKRWHTAIGLTGSGKTSFALWHVKAALDAGGHVIYLHFEEIDPGGVIDRLRGMGVSDEVIRERFHWASCEKKWQWGEMTSFLAELGQAPVLAVLDGINAACSQHGWKVSETEAIGTYRAMFVTPLVKAGAAVLSLGHPPKAKDRQNEMHGFGSTGWLDEVDGVGFRMVASKNAPMITGAKGFSALHVVKDRYSQVKQWGRLDTTKDQPWFYMGAFVVDDSQNGPTIVHLNVPEETGADGGQESKVFTLAGNIVKSLKKRGGEFDSQNGLLAMLHEDGVKFTQTDLPVAVELLSQQRRLTWPEVGRGKPRPGWLADPGGEG